MQARKLLILDDAIEDLRGIRQSILHASKSKTVANNYIKRIRAGLRHLEYTAGACQRYITSSGRTTEYRFCPVEHYVAFFTIEDDLVLIDRILHSRQDFDGNIWS